MSQKKSLLNNLRDVSRKMKSSLNDVKTTLKSVTRKIKGKKPQMTSETAAKNVEVHLENLNIATNKFANNAGIELAAVASKLDNSSPQGTRKNKSLMGQMIKRVRATLGNRGTRKKNSRIQSSIARTTKATSISVDDLARTERDRKNAEIMAKHRKEVIRRGARQIQDIQAQYKTRLADRTARMEQRRADRREQNRASNRSSASNRSRASNRSSASNKHQPPAKSAAEAKARLDEEYLRDNLKRIRGESTEWVKRGGIRRKKRA